jgi:histidinol-phosphate aminotransferase
MNNDLLKNMTPYKAEKGDFSIRLDVNESFVAPSDEALAEFFSEIKAAKLNRYPDGAASELCALYANYLGVESENVVAGNGSDELLSLIAQVFLKDNDRVLTICPDFSMYKFYAELRRGVVIEYVSSADMLLDAEDFVEAVQKVKPKIVFFSNPCNPTGQIIVREKVLKIAACTDAVVVADEAYMDFANESVVADVCNYKNLVVTRTLSKAGGIAAARVGFAVANVDIINTLKVAKSPYNVNALSQILASILLKDLAKIKQNVAKLVDAKNWLYSNLASLKTVLGCPFKPLTSHANFVCCLTDKAQEVKELLKNNGIAIRAFKDMVRISAGTESEMQKLVEVLRSDK